MDHKLFAKRMNKYSILYIEDEVQIRNYIGEFLNRYFKKIYICGSAEEGLVLYNEHKPDILFVDINLPKQSGIDFIKSVRQENSKTRIVILTAYTDKKIMIAAVELELTRYLVKPATSEDLLLALSKCADELEVYNVVNLGNGNVYSRRYMSIINNDKRTVLRKREMEILEYLIEHEGEVITYEMLEDFIWSDDAVTKDAIRSQIRNIRLKIGKECLENVIGIGYIFRVAT